MNGDVSLSVFEMDGSAAGPRRFSIMLLMRVERWDVRRDGPLTEVALQQKIEALGYEVSLRAYPSGTIAAAQSESRERIQSVVRGLIKVTIDGESAILGAGDIVFVPEGAVRRVEAIGASTATCFEGVKGPLG